MSDASAPAPVPEPDHLAKVVNDLAVALRDNDQLQALLGQARADCGAWETRAHEFRHRADLAANEAAKWREEYKRASDLVRQTSNSLDELSRLAETWRPVVEAAPGVAARLHAAEQELIDVKSQMAAMVSHPDVKAARLGELRARAKELAAEMNRVRNA